MSDRYAYRTQIIIAIIGVVGVIGGALFANWDKIFTKNSASHSIPAVNESNQSNKMAIISVFYFPSRKNDAKLVKAALDKEKYIVNIYKAGSDLASAEHRPSYIKYIDIRLSNKARIAIESILGHQFNFDEADRTKPWSKDNVLVVLTSRSNDP
jgi:hypothetical protein